MEEPFGHFLRGRVSKPAAGKRLPVQEMSKEQATRTAEEMAGRYAYSVKAEVELAMDASRALASALVEEIANASRNRPKGSVRSTSGWDRSTW